VWCPTTIRCRSRRRAPWHCRTPTSYFFVEDPKDLKGALAEAMNHRGPALVNVAISQGAARTPQQFRWHS
jgi:hypothetical protein